MEARHFNSKMDQSSQTWPLKLLSTQPARAGKQLKSANFFKIRYADATLDDEPNKLSRFSPDDDKHFSFVRSFQGLYGLPFFFTQQMSRFFKD